MRSAIACALLAAVGTIALTNSVSRSRFDTRLYRHGTPTEGVVVGVKAAWSAIDSDDIVIEYSVAGRQLRTTLPVADGANFPVGGRVQVRYDQRNPTRAVVDGMQRPVVIAILGWFWIAGAAFLAVIAILWTGLARRVYQAGGQHPATATSVTRMAGLRRASVLILQLDEATFELRLLPGQTPTFAQSPVTLRGKGRGGTVAVVEAAGDVFWPASRLKPGTPSPATRSDKRSG